MGNECSIFKESLPTLKDENINKSISSATEKISNKKTKNNRYLNDSRYVQLPYYDSARWGVIYESLSALHNSIQASFDFDMNLIEKTIISYNSDFKNEWNFSILFELIERYNPKDKNAKEFMLNLINLALDLPSLMSGEPIPILVRGISKYVNLSQKQCSSILANAFFCTFPRCENHNLNSINFNK